MTRELPNEFYGHCPVCGKRGWLEPGTDLQCDTCGTRFTVTNWKQQDTTQPHVINPAGGSNQPTIGTGDHEIDIASGDIVINGRRVRCEAETIDFETDISSTDNRAVVYRDKDGNVQKEVWRMSDEPDIRGFDYLLSALRDIEGVPVAEVYLPSEHGLITSSELCDIRVGE